METQSPLKRLSELGDGGDAVLRQDRLLAVDVIRGHSACAGVTLDLLLQLRVRRYTGSLKTIQLHGFQLGLGHTEQKITC